MGDWGAWHWGMGSGWIFAILFWVLVLVAVIALAKWLSSSIAWPGASRRPLDILRERYARGEITRDEYEQMRRDIES
jgi:putative membrane protein